MTSGGTTNSAVPGAKVPDGGWGWIIVLASFVIHFIMDGITYSMGEVFLHPMMSKFSASRAQVAIIFGMLPAVTLMTGPIATVFTNIYGCRKVTIVGACIASVGFLAGWLWANLWFYYIAIGLIGGIGFGLIYLPAIVSVNYYFETRRSFAIGIAVCGSGLGTLAFPFVMPYIIDFPLWYDFDGALLIEAAVILIVVIFGILMIPLPQDRSEIRRVERKSRIAAAKRLTSSASPFDEQQSKLLPTNRERGIPLQDVSITQRESSAVVPGEHHQQLAPIPHVDDTDIHIANPKENTSDELSPGFLRKDSVYQGSLHNIPLYNENTDEYRRQMETTTQTQVKKSFLAQLGEQIDLKLLKDAAFALFAISNFLTSLGFNVPYTFANDLATDAEVPYHQRTWIIMSIGISNCFGRVIIGILGDRKWINRLVLYNITLIVAGLATIAAPFCTSFVGTHMAYAGFFGFFSGGYVGLTSILVVDLVGVDKSSSGIGVTLLFQGVAAAIGTPIAGAMREALEGTERPYFWPYVLFGGSILISGVILFAIPFLRKRKLTKHEVEMGVQPYAGQDSSAPEQQHQQQQL